MVGTILCNYVIILLTKQTNVYCQITITKNNVKPRHTKIQRHFFLPLILHFKVHFCKLPKYHISSEFKGLSLSCLPYIVASLHITGARQKCEI